MPVDEVCTLEHLLSVLCAADQLLMDGLKVWFGRMLVVCRFL